MTNGEPVRETIRYTAGNYEVATLMGVNPTIHEDDFIFWFIYRAWGNDMERAVTNYYELGKYSVDLATDVLSEITRVKGACNKTWKPVNLLDFASGYGCMTRHAGKKFPDTYVTSCDIHPSAISFNSNVLGFDSFLSSKTPERLHLPLQDVIIALSFFSHMPNSTFSRWLVALSNHLKPGGALIFTANGFVTHVTGSASAVKVQPNGFGFSADSEQRDLEGEDYGLTISYPQWVFYAISQCPSLRLARFQEGLWWARQDLYVCMKEE